MIYLFTGQPGSGKTTIGKLLKELLSNAIQIDGDELRNIFTNTDYSESGRIKNIEKAHDIAYFLDKKGFDVIITMVSPFKYLRNELKSRTKVMEIYVHTSNIRGREQFFVETYEPPTNNYFDLDTTNKTDIESLKYLKNYGIIKILDK